MKRPQRDRPPIPLHELALGSKHAGVVITVKEHGAYVDFGAKRDGFVRLRVRTLPSSCCSLFLSLLAAAAARVDRISENSVRQKRRRHQ